MSSRVPLRTTEIVAGSSPTRPPLMTRSGLVTSLVSSAQATEPGSCARAWSRQQGLQRREHGASRADGEQRNKIRHYETTRRRPRDWRRSTLFSASRQGRASRSWRSSQRVRTAFSDYKAEASITAEAYITGRKSWAARRSMYGILRGRHLLRSAHHRLLRREACRVWDAVTCAC